MTGFVHQLRNVLGTSITKSAVHCAQMNPVGARRWQKQTPGAGFQA